MAHTAAVCCIDADADDKGAVGLMAVTNRYLVQRADPRLECCDQHRTGQIRSRHQVQDLRSEPLYEAQLLGRVLRWPDHDRRAQPLRCRGSCSRNHRSHPCRDDLHPGRHPRRCDQPEARHPGLRPSGKRHHPCLQQGCRLRCAPHACDHGHRHQGQVRCQVRRSVHRQPEGLLQVLLREHCNR